MELGFDDMPGRVFLDSGVLQTLQRFGGFIYENEPLVPMGHIERDPKGVLKLEALRYIMQVVSVCLLSLL